MVKNVFLNIASSKIKNYLAINYTKSVSLPREGTFDEFKNFKSLIKAPYVTDFECVLIPSNDNAVMI